jgi:hypothetical protein
MIGRRLLLRALVIAAAGATAVVPASATSIRRASLDRLVAENAIVVVGHIADVYSHWNADGTFILSDVRVVVDDALKGDAGQREFVFTAMGGTVGELSTVIVGGPEIEVGHKYLLFLNREDVPGLSNALMVRDLSQGIFDIVDSPKGKWAINQSIRHGLVPDSTGSVVPPGGEKGMSLAAISREIRRLGER